MGITAKDFNAIMKPKEEKNIIEQELSTGFNPTANTELMMIREIIDKMQDTDNIDLITELTDREIMLIARAKIMEQYYQIEVIGVFIEALLKLKLSRKRKSRSELVDIISKIITGSQEQKLQGKLMGDSW